MQANYERYIDLSIQWNRWLMKGICLWPGSPNTSMIEKFFYRITHAVCYTLITFLLVPCGVYAVMDVKGAYDKIRVFGPMSFFVMAITKYYSLSSHGKDIRECVERIECDWKNVKHIKDRDVMIANAKFGRQMAIVCTFFMYSTFVFYFIFIPISVGVVVAEDENLTYVPTAFPFSKHIVDPRRSPANEIIVSLQFLASFLNHTISATACSLGAVFAMHANGQMEILICWLEHLINGREDMSKSVDTRVADIVKQHMRVLKYLTITQKALQQVSFVEFLGCSTNMCLVGYYIVTEWSCNGVTVRVTYCMLLSTFMFNIFIFCYIGEIVADQWKLIGQMSYLSDWHELPGKRKLSFVLIIAMSNTSKKLTAGNIVELSLSTFSDVVKTSFSFFNMLRTVT